MKVTKAILLGVFNDSRTGKSRTLIQDDKVFTVPVRLAEQIEAGNIISVDLTDESTIENDGVKTIIVKPDVTTIVEYTAEDKLNKRLEMAEKVKGLSAEANAVLASMGF